MIPKYPSSGSCWTFSAANAIEAAYARRFNQLIDVSEQQMVDCVYPNYDGCKGGWPADALNYLTSKGGSVDEVSYPYTGVTGTCKTNLVPKVKLSGPRTITNFSTNFSDIKTAIVAYGSLSICVDATEWPYYGTGIFKARQLGNLNHAVNLIGWGSENGQDFWLIRNSWGPNWGESGYIRMSTTVGSTFYPNYTYGVAV